MLHRLSPLAPLCLAACAATSAVPDQVLSKAAFDRFEQLCLSNVATPTRAVAIAAGSAQRLGNGALTERASLSVNAVFDCTVTYKPANRAQAFARTYARSYLWGRLTNGLDGVIYYKNPNDFVAIGNAADRPLNSFQMTFAPDDNSVSLTYSAWIETSGG